MILFTVNNFQSIKKAEIKVKGFTVIYGTNNSGKSALMRAVQGMFKNTQGTYFVRHGTQKTTIDADFGDGQSLDWSKGDKIKPTYTINGGKPIYPGRAVPDEVCALGVHPITAGGREVWPQIAMQFDPLFLLDQPGSVMAEAVADVERVGKLNAAQKKAESDKRSADQTLRVRRGDEERLTEELELYTELDGLLDFVAKLDKRAQQAERMKSVLSRMVEMRDLLDDANETITRLDGLNVTLPSVEVAQDLVQQVKELRAFALRYQDVCAGVDQLVPIEKIQVPEVGNTAGRTLEALQKARNWGRKLAVVCDEMQTCEDELKKAMRERDTASKEVDTLLEDAGECPLCGSVF